MASSMFKVKKTSATKSTSKLPAVVPESEDIRKAIDAFSQLKAQLKHLEGELTVYTDTIVQFAHEKFADRHKNGQPGNLKIQGDESTLSFIVQARTKAKDQDKYDEFVTDYGEKMAEKLIEVDMGSMKLNHTFLSDDKNREKFEKAMDGLGEEFVSNLFTSPVYKVVKSVVADANENTKTASEFQQLILDLGLVAFLKVS